MCHTIALFCQVPANLLSIAHACIKKQTGCPRFKKFNLNMHYLKLDPVFSLMCPKQSSCSYKLTTFLQDLSSISFTGIFL